MMEAPVEISKPMREETGTSIYDKINDDDWGFDQTSKNKKGRKIKGRMPEKKFLEEQWGDGFQ